MRLGHRARQFKSRNCLLAGDRGKALEKLVERIPGFEVVVQRLDGHPSPTKTGVPPRISGSLCTTGVSLDIASCKPSLSMAPLTQARRLTRATSTRRGRRPMESRTRPLNVLHPSPIQLRSVLDVNSSSPSRSASERLSHRAIASSARSPAGSFRSSESEGDIG